MLRDREVVHHDRPRKIDRLEDRHLSPSAHDAVVEEGRLPGGLKKHQLTRRRVELGVGGHATGKGVRQMREPSSLQTVRHDIRQPTFTQGQDLTAMEDDVHVRVLGCVTPGALARRELPPGRRLDPAVAVPERTTFIEGHSVQHRGTTPPVQHALPFEAPRERVRAIAREDSAELARDLALHLEVAHDHLVGHRRQRPLVQAGHRFSLGRGARERPRCAPSPRRRARGAAPALRPSARRSWQRSARASHPLS